MKALAPLYLALVALACGSNPPAEYATSAEIRGQMEGDSLDAGLAACVAQGLDRDIRSATNGRRLGQSSRAAHRSASSWEYDKRFYANLSSISAESQAMRTYLNARGTAQEGAALRNLYRASLSNLNAARRLAGATTNTGPAFIPSRSLAFFARAVREYYELRLDSNVSAPDLESAYHNIIERQLDSPDVAISYWRLFNGQVEARQDECRRDPGT